MMETLPDDTCIGRVVRRGRPWEGWLTPYFREAADPDGVAIDVGANIGAHTATLAGLFSHVFAFEPQRRVHEVLVRNTREFGNVTAVLAAASDSAGFARLDQSSTNVGAAHLSDHGRGERVSLERIDDLVVPAPVRLVKIDAEKHERQVLAGAMETLDRDRPIIVMEDLTHARRALSPLGYRCHRVSLHDFVCVPSR